MMVPPRPLPSRCRRRQEMIAGAVLAVVFAAIAVPAAADGGLLIPGSAAPRSRLYVEIPGYTAYYVAPNAAAAPVSPLRVATPGRASAPVGAAVVSPAEPVTEPASEHPSRPAPGNLVAAAKPLVTDATDGLVLGYTPGSTAVPTTADSPLQALAERMRREPTMLIALEGFAGGGDSLKARRLAMWRARAVRTRLIEDGVDEQRIRLRAAEADVGAAAMERVDVRIVQP